ncbi:MAG: hypothetical protein O3C10_00015 [Chloroflexi bacterium]|nr:hypothetical protein [Chloroflexota bacterium]
MACRSILALPAAGLGFFFSAWILMICLGWRNEDIGIEDFGYVTSMYVTLVLWVVMAPAVAVMARAQMTPLIVRTRRGRIIDVD